LRSSEKSKKVNHVDLRSVAMGLASKGLGSYVEIMENWGLEDYKIWLDREAHING
jgi:hypothetical protein